MVISLKIDILNENKYHHKKNGNNHMWCFMDPCNILLSRRKESIFQKDITIHIVYYPYITILHCVTKANLIIA